jgi:hypothetical protein
MADRYGIGVDLAVHQPREGGDPRNFHAHLLATTREVTPWGFGEKAGLDMHAVQRAKQGLSDHSEEYTAVRERWAAHMNDAFREANIDVRVDHRTLAAQGIDRQPMVYVPMEFYQRQMKGLEPGQIERLRDEYRARVSARREQARQQTHAKEPILAKESVLAKEPTPTSKAAPAHEPTPTGVSAPAHEPTLGTGPVPVRQSAAANDAAAPLEKSIDPRNVEEIRKQAVQSWLRMRAKEAESTLEKGAATGDSQQRSGEQRQEGDRSAGDSPEQDKAGAQHAESDHNAARSGEPNPGHAQAGEQHRSHGRIGTGDRGHGHDSDPDHNHGRDKISDPAHSSGYDDDAGM